MSFLVLFNSNGVPIDIETTVKIAVEKQNGAVLGKFRQTAFIWTDFDSAAARGAGAAPIDLERRIWIVGRVRLDGRETLYADLPASAIDCDKLLCLRSYAKWGDQCLEHLQGDFCFVIWDEDRQQLFCARDQLGVKPLFYAQAGNRWFVSDSLENIRSKLTANNLDEYWLADFLTTGFCLDFHRSVYEQIKRVPPAHVLIASAGGNLLRRYWKLNIGAPIFYRDEKQYLDHFHEVMALSIRDRLPQGQVGISMSGGLDSSTLAAKAVAITGDASRVIAYTRYFEHLIPDEEKHFSSLVASRLGIQLTLRAVDDTYYDSLWETRDLRTPEPTTSITFAASERMYGAEMTKQAQVWLYGEGPDNALTFEWKAYLQCLRQSRDWPRLGDAIIQYLFSKKACEWRATIKSAFNWGKKKAASLDPPPRWMNDTFVRKVDLAARLREAGHISPGAHAWRPRAIASFMSSIWPTFLEGFDTSVSGTQIEWRHPYLDLRVLTFLLSVPSIPWTRRKLLLRKSMKGALPEAVLSRTKAPLVDDPLVMMLRKYPLANASLCEPIRQFVNEGNLPGEPNSADEIHDLIKVRALNFWLRNR